MLLWAVVYQKFRRWDAAGCFEAMVNDMRSLLQAAQGCKGQPSAVIFEGRTMQSTCENRPCAEYYGYKRRNGSKVHIAGDTLGHMIALTVTPADEQERAQCDALCQQVLKATGDTVKGDGNCKSTGFKWLSLRA